MNSNEPISVVVTGSTGFVGRALVHSLASEPQYTVTALSRRQVVLPATVKVGIVSDLSDDPVLAAHLEGADALIHCAARVHVMSETHADAQREYDRVNVEATLSLARLAIAAGIRRFIFISSIKVNGESTEHHGAYRADDSPDPSDPYGISKAKAENLLMELGASSGLEVVIIRPVLVYGPGVKANFLSMMRWLDRGVVLPFGAIHNKRSLVAIDNLVDLIKTCIFHPRAAGECFLVSDGEDLSTTELLSRTAQALGKSARLVPVPVPVLSCLARLVGRRAVSQRLCGSLVVDITKTRELLDWAPPVRVTDALLNTARDYKDSKNK